MWQTLGIVVALIAWAFGHAMWENIQNTASEKKRKTLQIVFWSVVLPIVIALGSIFHFAWWEEQTEIGKLKFSMLVCFAGCIYLFYEFFKGWKKQHHEYECWFYKSIYVQGHEDDIDHPSEILEQTNVLLPFPPYEGLSVENDLKIKDAEGNTQYVDFHSGLIKRVIWNGVRFICWVEPHEMSEKNDFGAVLFRQEERGWSISGFDSGGRQVLKEYKEKNETN